VFDFSLPKEANLVANGVTLILTMHGCILMQLRDNDPSIGNPFRWTLPGGGIEPGETPRQAARRELREEFPNMFVCLYEIGTTSSGTALFYGEILSDQPMLINLEGCAWGMFKPEAVAAYQQLASEVPGGIGGIIARRFAKQENFQALKKLIELNQPMTQEVLEPLNTVPAGA
jgi:hypothetical protein